MRDEWQGKGLGTLLFGALTAAAREQGIAGFTASVLADNVGMMRVFHRTGYPIESRLVDGTYELTIMFEGTPSPAASSTTSTNGDEPLVPADDAEPAPPVASSRPLRLAETGARLGRAGVAEWQTRPT